VSPSEPLSEPALNLELARLRQAIDEVDAELVRLLDERARLAREVGEIKARNSIEVYAPGRESQVLKRVGGLGSGDFPRPGLEAVFREIISSARGLEAGITVAYLGTEASLAHLAARSVFGASAQLGPQTSSSAVLEQIRSGGADYGVLPVEMVEDGAVVHVLDRLWDTQLKVCRAAELALGQHLLSLATRMTAVNRVFASATSLAQAGSWLRARLGGAALVEVASASEAARRALEDPASAAIGPAVLAEESQLRVLEANVEGEGTRARFYVIGQSASQRTGHDRSLFGFRLADQTGRLRDALNVFAEHAVDLRSIEARSPGAGEVVVFGELAGHQDDAAVASALDGLARLSPEVQVLGCYPEFPPGS